MSIFEPILVNNYNFLIPLKVLVPHISHFIHLSLSQNDPAGTDFVFILKMQEQRNIYEIFLEIGKTKKFKISFPTS